MRPATAAATIGAPIVPSPAMKAVLAALALFAGMAPLALAADTAPVRLVVDASAGSVGAALMACPHERLGEPGEPRHWHGASGWAANPMIYGGGLLGAAAADGVAEARRLRLIAPLAAQVEADGGLAKQVMAAIERALTAHGVAVERSFTARGAVIGYLQRDLETPQKTRALIVGRVDGPLVKLNWDDRQLLVEASIREYVYITRKYRERSKIDVHYVGYPLARDEHAVERWAADGAALFQAELDRALAAVFTLGLAPDDLPAKSGRKEVVALQVGDETHEFRARLWKELDGIAVLVDRKGALLLVATAPPATLLAQD